MVVISYEMIHDTRVIYTDGRPHVNDRIRGTSEIREDDGRATRSSSRRRTSPIRRASAPTATAAPQRQDEDDRAHQARGQRHRAVPADRDDPVTYPRPFTMSIPLTPLDGGDLLPYECHEGNEAVRNSLGAERAEDRALAADLAKGIKRERRPVQDGLDVGGRPTGAGARGAGPGSGRGAAPIRMWCLGSNSWLVGYWIVGSEYEALGTNVSTTN
jgi:hypothetical protein